MKTSIKWLQNYVDIQWDSDELADRLTLAGLEVDEITRIGSVAEGVIVAEIRARRPHPNADKLSLCDVDTGSGLPIQVVCGAPNCDAGAKVPLATIGTVLGEGFKIKKTKLRGEQSSGMLCSERELGLSEDHSGLLILPDDAPVGTPLSAFLRSDTVIDWEITPNRPDWLSHIGIAREIAAVGSCRALFRLPEIAATAKAAQPCDEVAAVEVLAPDLCPRYVARVIRNVSIEPSPDWMQQALEAVGLRPINNVVDVTNYVMMECGQPLHAFDYEKLAGGRIVVRRARPGENMTTLDGQEHELTGEHLLIADAEKGIALAGVMGGANSEIASDTSTVLLESAAFSAPNIRATSKTLGLSSDSSYRFERGVDIEMTEFASQRAAALICELGGGELLEGSIDVYAGHYVPAMVQCRFARIDQLLGVRVAPDTVVDFFERLGLDVAERNATGVTVAVPPFRLDIEREADLIEEVARLYGLDNIPAEPAPARVGGPIGSDSYYPLEEIRAQLIGLGLDETMTYSLLSVETATAGTGFEADELVMLANPLSNEVNCTRPSLIPGLLQTIAHNVARNNVDLAFFELGRVLSRSARFAEERYQVGMVLSGRAYAQRLGTERERDLDFFDMKGLLEGWLAARRVTRVACRPVDFAAFKQGTGAEFFVKEEQIAVFGEVSDEHTRDMRLKYPVFLALVEADKLAAAPVRQKVYRELPQFPAVVRDVAVVAAADLPNQAIVDAIEAVECPWLEQVELFDVYRDDEALGAGRRGLAYSLTYRDRARTLTDEQVNEAHDKVRAALAAKLPVELR